MSDLSLPYGQRPAGRGLDWADEVYNEHHTQIILKPGPVAGYTLGDMTTTYTHVVGGERITAAPPSCDCPSFRAWFIGGSAAFGVGQRDDHTIASDLVGLAAQDGVSLTVENMGTPGWTLWQEYQGILAKLARGEAPPDLIIFYDGFNDMAQSFMQQVTHRGDFDAPVVFDGAALEALGSFSEKDVSAAEAAIGDPGAFGKKAATRYARLRGVIAKLLEGQGIATHFFFQPDALTATVQRGKPIPSFMFPSVDPGVTAGLVKSLEAASQTLPDPSDNLRHLFDADGVNVFFDLSHMNEAAARRAAAAAYAQLKPQIVAGATR